MKKNLNSALLISVLMVFYLSIEKVSAQWTSPGPDGGYVSLLTASGSTLYAVAGVFSPNAEFLYTSTDNGNTWTPLVSATWPASPSDSKKAIAKIGSSLFVGTFNGIWRSDDNGLTWVKKYTGGGYAFAGNGTALFAGTDYGLVRSADNGETWAFNDLGGALFMGGIASIVVNGNNVYASSEMDGVTVHSEDNGLTFTPYEDIWFDANSLAVIGNDLYAGTQYYGIQKLTNCSGLWAQVYSGASYCKGLVGDGSVIIATSLTDGVVRSTDGGATWTNVTANGIVQYYTNNGSPAAMTSAGIFVGTTAGIYKTTNKGNTWARSDAGIHAHSISAPAVSALGTDIYTGSRYGGVFRSTNNGQSFMDVSNSLVVNVPEQPGHPNLVGTNTTKVFSGAYMSTDGGTTWAPHNSPGSLGNLPWMEQGGALITVSQFEGVYRSVNNGGTWTLSNSGITTLSSFLTLYSDGTVLYLGGLTQNSAQTGAYYSTDNGATWHISSFSTFPPGIGSFFFTGTTMLMSSRMAGWGSYEGIYRSTDNGANWIIVQPHCAVAKWAISGSTIIITGNTELVNGVPSTCIYTSDDDGLTWTLATMPDYMNPSAFAVEGSHIFLGTTNAKILYSKDNCVNWTDVSYTGNYPKIFANNLTICNNKVYASSVGGSLLARSLDDFVTPTIPVAISGSAAPCIGASLIYSVPVVAGVSTYTWQFPSGWVVTAGAITNSVTVSVGSTAGVILVTPSNAGGTGPAQFMVVTPTTNAPAQPSTITGSATPTEGSSQAYSVTNVSGVTYTWTFPSGWVQTAGGTTNSVTVTVGSGAGNIVVTPSTVCGDGTTRTLAVTPSGGSKTLNLVVLFEGMYAGSGTMHQANDENGAHWPAGVADHITVELHNASSYSTIAYTATDVPLSTAGVAIVTVPSSYSGSYYITVKHRNSIQAVSATAKSFAGSSVTQSFEVASDVFGGNVVLMAGPGTHYAMYGGDVNQDGIVDGSDFAPVDNLAAQASSGYLPEDVNGDGLIDGSDFLIIDNNASQAIGAVTP